MLASATGWWHSASSCVTDTLGKFWKSNLRHFFRKFQTWISAYFTASDAVNQLIYFVNFRLKKCVLQPLDHKILQRHIWGIRRFRPKFWHQFTLINCTFTIPWWGGDYQSPVGAEVVQVAVQYPSQCNTSYLNLLRGSYYTWLLRLYKMGSLDTVVF